MAKSQPDISALLREVERATVALKKATAAARKELEMMKDQKTKTRLKGALRST